MLTLEALHTCLPQVLTNTALPFPHKQIGKVRDSYTLPSGERLIITTDRLSAFDRVVGAAPYKGQVLNQLSAWWFQQTADILPNHLISLPDPNAALVQNLEPYPIEVIVRGYITGVTSTALWRRYELGERQIYGYTFPEGLQKNQALPQPIITPTTKGGPNGRDERLSCEEVVSQGWVNSEDWQVIQNAALALFKRGQIRAQEAGLILVDTKYEFAWHKKRPREIFLIDEIHTPDSSRFWEQSSYQACVSTGKEPDSFDKELTRLAFIQASYTGQGEPPALPESVWLATSQRYIAAYERITGKNFVPGTYPILPRLKQHLSLFYHD
jgi:phosphoribosylaminoimidazole-succinocarboxamide synthase